MRASMAPSDTGSAISSSNLVLTAPASSLQLAADLVTSNLMKLGTLTLDEFLSPPYLDPPPPEVNLTLSYVARRVVDPAAEEEKKLPAHKATPLFLLNQVCSQTLGSIEPLKYEFIDDGDEKQCILTITRPNGQSRSYSVVVEYERKADAREAVAIVAVEMGALDFIKNGAPDHTLKRGLVLAPLDAPESEGVEIEHPERDPSPAVEEIERCCVEWRAGRVKPHWVAVREFKPAPKFGCALRVALSAHSAKIYSVDATYDHFEDARSACADEAVADGVIEFIKHGNGQKHPAPPDYSNQHAVAADAPVTAVTAASVEDFFESLPRPFPEAEFVGKKIDEISAVPWLNALAQSAKGGRLTLRYIPVPDSKYGLHGFLLRLSRPGEVKSYLVDPIYPKRADAKVAVTLLAMSQGVGQWIRKVAHECEEKLPHRLKEYITMRILPMVTLEYSKIWPGRHPEIWTFTRDKDAHGCIMTLKLKFDPSPDEVRTWEVPTEYRSRNDAKLAVLDLAFENGAVEFLRFRGRKPPEGYVVDVGPTAYRKRKLEEQDAVLSGPNSSFKRMRTESAAPAPAGGAQRERLPPTGPRHSRIAPSLGGPSSDRAAARHRSDRAAQPPQLPTPPYATPASTPGPQVLPPIHYSAPRPTPPDVPPHASSYDYPAHGQYPVLHRDPHDGYRQESAHPPSRPSSYGTYADPYGPPSDSYYGRHRPYSNYAHPSRHPPDSYGRDPYSHPVDNGYGPPEHSDSRSYPDAYTGYAAGYDRSPPRDYSSRERPPSPPSPERRDSGRRSPSPRGALPSPPRRASGATDNGRRPPASPSKARKSEAPVTPPSPSTSAQKTRSKRKRERSESPDQLVVTALPSFKQQLIDFCKEKKKSSPMFANEANADGTFRVWIIVDKERMEMQTAWADVAEGEDRTAKQVLKRLSGMK
ncbi:unnamed protein product [Peniophora sp. CBMAI 1063]|nr:unnamed protein product [Peniophora sp. CBMAI 1063]